MVQSICVLFFLLITIAVDCTAPISYIDTAAYVPSNSVNVSSYSGTCFECICFAFLSNTSSNYEALNCYTNNNTCLLFSDFLSRSNIRINTDSKLYFVQVQSYTTAASCIYVYGQCGGSGFNGLISCCIGSSCIYKNASYSQCLPTSVSTALTSTQSLITTTYFNDSRQDATSNVYYDCCKVSCGWPGKASVTSPVKTCTQDGITPIGNNTQSACTSGTAYTCTDQQPWNVSDTLSYAYAGATIIGQGESNWCCTCYSLLFTSGSVIGKELIVQVTNTAYAAVNLFVIQIPGGGWGGSSNGCLNQFNSSSYLWGQQYGGFSNRSDCNNLPTVLQAGCFWRFDWYMNANSPGIRFKQVSCPAVLTAHTGCNRI